MSIEFPPLPYTVDALAPFISATTIHTHHSKHHRAYVGTANALVAGTDLAGAELDTVIRHASLRAAKDPQFAALFNSAAQAANHALYWGSLRPKNGRRPEGALASLIRDDFTSEVELAAALKVAANRHFGSGWAWLVFDGTRLRISTTTNADTPILRGQTPLLVLDLWEHAYYLDYQERRAAYIEGVVDNLLNWDCARARLERALARSPASLQRPA